MVMPQPANCQAAPSRSPSPTATLRALMLLREIREGAAGQRGPSAPELPRRRSFADFYDVGGRSTIAADPADLPRTRSLATFQRLTLHREQTEARSDTQASVSLTSTDPFSAAAAAFAPAAARSSMRSAALIRPAHRRPDPGSSHFRRQLSTASEQNTSATGSSRHEGLGRSRSAGSASLEHHGPSASDDEGTVRTYSLDPSDRHSSSETEVEVEIEAAPAGLQRSRPRSGSLGRNPTRVRFLSFEGGASVT